MVSFTIVSFLQGNFNGYNMREVSKCCAVRYI